MSPENIRRFAEVYTRLPRREKQIFDMYGVGMKYDEIAESLFISRNTVKQYMYQIRHKFPYVEGRDLQAQTAYFLGHIRK